MSAEAVLRERLRKIEALFAGAATPGERTAAQAAAERIRARLQDMLKTEAATEIRFSVSDPWSRQLLIALCRCYGLRPYRYPRMHRQTVIVKAPRSFLDQTLWPEFKAINAALLEYLSEITERVIREEVYRDTRDVDEVMPAKLAG
jgi:hypothetical protein